MRNKNIIFLLFFIFLFYVSVDFTSALQIDGFNILNLTLNQENPKDGDFLTAEAHLESTAVNSDINCSFIGFSDYTIFPFTSYPSEITENVSIGELPPGDYEITLRCEGDSYIITKEKNLSFTVSKKPPTADATLYPLPLLEGDIAKLNVTVFDFYDSQINLTLNWEVNGTVVEVDELFNLVNGSSHTLALNYPLKVKDKINFNIDLISSSGSNSVPFHQNMKPIKFTNSSRIKPYCFENKCILSLEDDTYGLFDRDSNTTVWEKSMGALIPAFSYFNDTLYMFDDSNFYEVDILTGDKTYIGYSDSAGNSQNRSLHCYSKGCYFTDYYQDPDTFDEYLALRFFNFSDNKSYHINVTSNSFSLGEEYEGLYLLGTEEKVVFSGEYAYTLFAQNNKIYFAKIKENEIVDSIFYENYEYGDFPSVYSFSFFSLFSLFDELVWTAFGSTFYVIDKDIFSEFTIEENIISSFYVADSLGAYCVDGFECYKYLDLKDYKILVEFYPEYTPTVFPATETNNPVIYNISSYVATENSSAHMFYHPKNSFSLDYCLIYSNKTGSWDLTFNDTNPELSQDNYFGIYDLENGIYSWNVKCFSSGISSNYYTTNGTINVSILPPLEEKPELKNDLYEFPKKDLYIPFDSNYDIQSFYKYGNFSFSPSLRGNSIYFGSDDWIELKSGSEVYKQNFTDYYDLESNQKIIRGPYGYELEVNSDSSSEFHIGDVKNSYYKIKLQSKGDRDSYVYLDFVAGDNYTSVDYVIRTFEGMFDFQTNVSPYLNSEYVFYNYFNNDTAILKLVSNDNLYRSFSNLYLNEVLLEKNCKQGFCLDYSEKVQNDVYYFEPDFNRFLNTNDMISYNITHLHSNRLSMRTGSEIEIDFSKSVTLENLTLNFLDLMTLNDPNVSISYSLDGNSFINFYNWTFDNPDGSWYYGNSFSVDVPVSSSDLKIKIRVDSGAIQIRKISATANVTGLDDSFGYSRFDAYNLKDETTQMFLFNYEDEGVILSKGYDFFGQFYIEINDSKLYFNVAKHNFSWYDPLVIDISSNEWHHLAYTLRDNELTLYYDGLRKGSLILDQGIASTPVDLSFGSMNGIRPITGNIDEFYYVNEAYCKSEIYEAYLRYFKSNELFVSNATVCMDFQNNYYNPCGNDPVVSGGSFTADINGISNAAISGGDFDFDLIFKKEGSLIFLFNDDGGLLNLTNLVISSNSGDLYFNYSFDEFNSSNEFSHPLENWNILQINWNEKNTKFYLNSQLIKTLDGFNLHLEELKINSSTTIDNLFYFEGRSKDYALEEAISYLVSKFHQSFLQSETIVADFEKNIFCNSYSDFNFTSVNRFMDFLDWKSNHYFSIDCVDYSCNGKYMVENDQNFNLTSNYMGMNFEITDETYCQSPSLTIKSSASPFGSYARLGFISLVGDEINFTPECQTKGKEIFLVIENSSFESLNLIGTTFNPYDLSKSQLNIIYRGNFSFDKEFYSFDEEPVIVRTDDGFKVVSKKEDFIVLGQ